MKLYAIVNARLEADVTSVRHTLPECLDLLDSRGFDTTKPCHLDVVEYDDGFSSDNVFAAGLGLRPLEVNVRSGTTTQTVWRGSTPENRESFKKPNPVQDGGAH